MQVSGLREQQLQADFCVVGGGMAGLCAAVAAARRGAKTILIHERPVLGGNASSEIRMHICGAHGSHNRETGILEEIALENMHRNPHRNYSIWDSVLYQFAAFQPGLHLVLNCSVNGVAMEGSRIASVRGWQLSTQSWVNVKAKVFADCSGDSILAPLTGAEFRWGREAASEFGEDIEPPVADKKTMGLSCLLQAKASPRETSFVAPAWAHVFPKGDPILDLKNEKGHYYRGHALGRETCNFWWIESGGEQDSIDDSESIRHELQKIVWGVWDHIKNQDDHGCAKIDLDWVGSLPGRRESRRYVGDHILTQNDVRGDSRFPDLVAYGGWSMDDHHPAGFRYPGHPTTFHPAPSPYGIPYRCLYSKNIENLMFAGRNISTTHAALSSCRVMATCALLGQAVGTAAALATAAGLTPRQVGQQKIAELKQALMDDDCYLPWNKRAVPALTGGATLQGGAPGLEALRNGHDRSIGSEDNGVSLPLGQPVTYEWKGAQPVSRAAFTFDSDLNREKTTEHKKLRGPLMIDDSPLQTEHPVPVPPTMVKDFLVEVRRPDGAWELAHRIEGNFQRRVRLPLSGEATGLRFTPKATWGEPVAHVFSFDVG